MKSDKEKLPPYTTAGKLWKSLLICLPMILLTFLFLTGGDPDFSNPIKFIAFIMVFLFFNFLFFKILYTGKTDKYRATGFILYAVFLSLVFITNMVETREAMSISEADFLECNIPFCHIVITMILIPIVFTKSIIFPGAILGGFAPVSSMLIIWILASIAIGKGFCSWGCFYGGWDDGFSRIRKKPLIKKVNPIFRWFPFAVLLLIALSAAMTLSPTYCDWACPFKTVTEFEAVTSIETLIKTIIFLSLFIGLVIVLPILTRKRVQCGMFCPMGALTSFTNKINVFDVRIDREKCTQCGLCNKNCPILSLDSECFEKGKTHFTCSKCGKCIDNCPEQAIHYHIKGTPENKRITTARILFIFSAFLFLAIFSGGIFQMGIIRIINFITTGSFF